jgi:homoserine dehydrogenase
LNVVEKPGVMHAISGILGKQGISIASMIQYEPGRKGNDEHAVVFLTTHEAREGDLLLAISQLEESSVVLGSIVRMRVQS